MVGWVGYFSWCTATEVAESQLVPHLAEREEKNMFPVCFFHSMPSFIGLPLWSLFSAKAANAVVFPCRKVAPAPWLRPLPSLHLFHSSDNYLEIDPCSRKWAWFLGFLTFQKRTPLQGSPHLRNAIGHNWNWKWVAVSHNQSRKWVVIITYSISEMQGGLQSGPRSPWTFGGGMTPNKSKKAPFPWCQHNCLNAGAVPFPAGFWAVPNSSREFGSL